MSLVNVNVKRQTQGVLVQSPNPGAQVIVQALPKSI